MNEKELLLGLLTKTLNKSDEELTELLYQTGDDGETLKDGVLDEAISLIEAKITKLKEGTKVDEKKLRDEGYKRAQKEIMGSFETELKEKYNLETETTGAELVDELVNKFKSDDSELTPDKIKLTDTYRAREKELRKELKDALKEKETEVELLKTGFVKQQTWNTVSSNIRKLLHDKNPALPKNQKAANNLVDLFVNSFNEYDWQTDSDGKPLPVKDGKRVEDALGNEVSFDSLVDSRIGDYFDLPVQGQRGSGGNEGSGGSGTDGVPSSFKDEKDYLKYVYGEPDIKKQVAAKMIFEAQQK